MCATEIFINFSFFLLSRFLKSSLPFVLFGCSKAAVKSRPHLHVTTVDGYSLYRCEIEATLERLRKLERELYSKEKELEERERRLRLWEERLMERSNMSPSPTSLLMERSNISPVSRSGVICSDS